uniref:Uncharacterized protein n=1 Tax=Chromera velia CCMP2878 TaxID=1169474 RepID=A0A0G4G7A3_9ALVE|eukprot:Cvel_20588.t1-p1 / transcript=Cvel_20588.t1 / gene=Cvel_20588 / organism=Chromera_velia_CCMP2878 / gene_product=Ras-related protein Rab-8A, putative / transcript_product=Ras-related protein Rab-8A, putative / location=Cvel_scaffold1860:29483-32957(-) / protein_length=225 / sequence_SO=supercontig / SO=protein_coding / is_pseudo=false
MATPSASSGAFQYDHLIKLLILGDSGVGKSCLLLRFADDSFSPSHISTIGIDSKIKNLELDGYKVKLQIWDTAGQERFRTITQTYYRSAMGILLVYDVTSQESFNNVRHWIRQVEAHAANGICKVLVGNKSDVRDREVSIEEGKELAEEYEIPFVEASAKSGACVFEAFEVLARGVLSRLLERQKEAGEAAERREGGVFLETEESHRKGRERGGCCGGNGNGGRR